MPSYRLAKGKRRDDGTMGPPDVTPMVYESPNEHCMPTTVMVELAVWRTAAVPCHRFEYCHEYSPSYDLTDEQIDQQKQQRMECKFRQNTYIEHIQMAQMHLLRAFDSNFGTGDNAGDEHYL